MRRASFAAWGAVAVLLAGCGGDATTAQASGTTGGAGSTTATAGGSTSTGVGGGGGGATAGSGGGGGSVTSTGTGGGGGTPCPDIACSDSCPQGNWLEVDGCPSCACAAELQMIVAGQARPVQHVSLGVNASQFIGRIDRWVFDLLWTYDDPGAADEAEEVALTVRIMRTAPEYEPAVSNATWFHPLDDGMPLEVLPGTFTLYGFGIITSPLTPASGYFSIRRVGDQFEGHVFLDGTTEGGGPGMVHVSGPFKVAVPAN